MTEELSTRERIERGALRLFAERGFHGTAVPLVAEEAGVGAGTIYRHFEDKQELVNAVFRRAKRRLWEAVSDDLDLSAEPKALFDAFWDRLAEFARTNPVTFRFLELHHHADYLDDASLAVERDVLGELLGLCEALSQAGVLSDEMPPEGFMAFVWGAFVGIFDAGERGYLELNDDLLEGARDGCWRAFTSTTNSEDGS